MYVWHKYWSRKTWNVVGEFIKTYTAEGEIVFDPFAGSGVVAIEAIRNGRKAIICDLNPAASNISETTLKPVNWVALRSAFDRVADRIRKEIESLYAVHCEQCGKAIIAACFVREGNTVTEARYPSCPYCQHRCETGCVPSDKDIQDLEELEASAIPQWYPANKLEYANGQGFKEKQQFDSLDQLFTKRNLRAVAMLHEAIQEEPNTKLRGFLMAGFTSMVHLCTRMMPVGNPQPSNHYTYFSSPGWTQHSYWSAQLYMEQNVWTRFEGAMIGGQGLINAKIEQENLLPATRVSRDWRDVFAGKADVAVVTDDCLSLMKTMDRGSVDYIFTDPPYDASVQYGELSYLWNAWLKKDFQYTEALVANEIIRNERQDKNFDLYHRLLSESFKRMFEVLKPGRYSTLTFHNPTFKVRNATVRAGVFAGFDYKHIHHQPLGQVSAKAMLQPFGSAQGDFYLRFYKPLKRRDRKFTEVSEERFRRIVVDTCTFVIAERAEPTPYTILVNKIDPVLARAGLFGTLKTGLDIKTVLKEEIGKTFILVKAKLGGAEGDLWWFNDPIFVARLSEVPLTERVEQTVYRIIQDRGRATFTEVWDAVSQEFPNSLTSDSTSIKEALELYARKANLGFWVMRDEVVAHVRAHSEIIAILAAIGKARGYDIWIGRNEQNDVAGGIAKPGKLGDLITKKPKALEGVSNLTTVLDMDLLWLSGNQVVCCFEVESTTTMTSALQRGSNLPIVVKKLMVIPEERSADFERKMHSPLFSDRFVNDGWGLLYFGSLRSVFSTHREGTDLAGLISVKPESLPAKQTAPRKKSEQKLLFS
jgi:16S rRNA G966 N2-methylase RsmD